MGNEVSYGNERTERKRRERTKCLYGELERALRFSRNNKLNICSSCIEFCKSSYDCYISKRYLRARDYLRDIKTCVSANHNAKLFPDSVKNILKIITRIDKILILYPPSPRSSMTSSSLSFSSSN